LENAHTDSEGLGNHRLSTNDSLSFHAPKAAPNGVSVAGKNMAREGITILFAFLKRFKPMLSAGIKPAGIYPLGRIIRVKAPRLNISMNLNKKLFASLFALCLMPLFTQAQEKDKNSLSVFTGGMAVKSSLLSTTKLGYESGHFGALADLTYDTYKETWSDGSKSFYQLYGFSASGRYYLQPLGRSIFAEVSIGMGRPSLTTTEGDQQKVKKDVLPLSGFGLGWRFGKKPKGLFGEVGFRWSYSLKDSHLYTTDAKPDQQGLDNISYQSWLFEKGKGSGQLYLGIGYSF
jgi:hypothetical protein